MFKVDEFTVTEIELIEKMIDSKLEILYEIKGKHKHIQSHTNTDKKIDALIVLKTKIIEYNKTKNYIKERLDRNNK